MHQPEQFIQSPALTTTDAQALDLLNQQLERLSERGMTVGKISRRSVAACAIWSMKPSTGNTWANRLR